MISRGLLVAAAVFLVSAQGAYAHFGMVIPSDDIVSQGDARQISHRLMFVHPLEM